MVKKFFVLVVLLFIAAPCFAQIVDTAWVRRYDGPASAGDDARAITIDDSGNVYVTGYSPGIGTNYDYATIKYYPNGDTAWVRRYNGPGNLLDWALDIAVDGSGNVYVTGQSDGSGTYSDYATIKYDASGNELWVKRYDGPGTNDYARAIAVDDSGNVYVTGGSSSGPRNDYATIKYFPNGDTAWVRRYDGPAGEEDFATDIVVDDSGNVYVTGKSAGSGTYSDYATIKYDASGNELWVRRYDGPGNNSDDAWAIAVDGSGNVCVTGKSWGSGTADDYATIKYYPTGDTAWLRRYEEPENSSNEALAIALDDSGNVYVTGRSYISGTEHDYATIKYYPNGDTAWVRRYNGPGSDDDGANAIAVDDSGNVYVTGYSYGSGTYEDYATIKYDASGNELWVKRYDGPANSDDFARAIAVDDSGNVYVTGEAYGSGTGWDYATIKYFNPPPPTADFVGSPLVGEKALAVSFTDLSEGIVNSRYWSFGDLYTSTQQNPVHTYGDAGYYDVKLVVTNDFGSDSLIRENYIQVLAKPLADFTADPTVGDLPLGVQFTDNSIGDITDWLWDFGDDSISTLQNPYHEYSSFGTYDVTLIATSTNGVDSVTKENFIFAYPALSGDSVKVLDVTAIPNQEDVVVPIIQSNTDSLAAIDVALTFDSEALQVDSVSFVGSRTEYFPVKADSIRNEEGTLFFVSMAISAPCLPPGQGLFAKLHLSVKDVIPPTPITFDTTTFWMGEVRHYLKYVDCEAGEIFPDFGSGTLFIEKADTIPPEVPQNVVALPLESGVSLTWDAVTDPDLRLYAVYKDYNRDSLDDTLATTNDPFYLDLTVSPGETLFYSVSAVDSSWNESEYSDYAEVIFGDISAPVITLGPVEIAITDTMATIYWETDEKADGWVEIWVDTSWVPAGSHLQFLLEHTITLNGLVPSTSYEYRVHSDDSLGNGPTYSDPDTFTTASGPDVTPPQIIFGPAVVHKTHNSATIQWTTDEIANSKVYYGQETPYSDSAVDPGFVASHSMTLTGLLPATQYFYIVSSEDPSGNGPTYSGGFYGAGDGPNSVFCADLDGDTDLDLAVADFYSDNVSILKNNGDGTFQTKVDYGAGDEPWSVFCGDLDGDLDLDLAVANWTSNNVSILKNNGDGTFQAKVDYGVGDHPWSVFCADLDGDSDLDLAVANEYGASVSILKNNGDGTFQTKVDYGAGDSSVSVFCADLDGDLDLDLAVANFGSDDVSILKNNGDGTFQTKVDYGVGDGPVSVFCADLDGDSDLDLTVANYGSGNVSILKNNGDGTFQPKVDYAAGDIPGSVFCADLDGDLDLDLAVANWTSDNVSILKNSGDGTFQTKVDYGAGDGPTSVFCTDLDGDSDLDLAVANCYSDNVSILRNNGDGTFTAPDSFTTDAAPDITPPAIVEGPIHSGISQNKAVIDWVTDEIATSIVQYGPSELYGSERTMSAFVQNHQIVLTNLQDSTLYHYRVGSVDPESNGPTWSSNFWFWTHAAPHAVPPIILTGPYSSWLNDTQAQIDWTTDEVSDSWVYYRLEGSVEYGQAGSPRYVKVHSVVLTNLVPDTTYDFYVSSTDPQGNTVESEHTGGGLQPLDTGYDQFTTKASADATPPVIISGPHVRYKTHNRATVEWVTDETGNSMVEYGEDIYYGTEITYTEATINHSAYLTNLNPGTTYHFRVGSKDIANNGPTYSSDVTFTTPADVPDTDPPIITVLPGVAYLDQTLAIITWETDEPSDSYMGYELIGGLAERIVGESFCFLTHEMKLSLSSSYDVRVFSSDQFGNGPTYSDYFVVTAPTSADVDPPVLTSGPEIVYTSQNSAKIKWETDELSSSFIEYGLSEEYTDTEGNPDNDSLHEVILTNLTTSTTYHYRVKSADLFGNIYLGADSTFTTEGSSDITPPATPTGLSSAYGDQWIKLTWNENPEGDLSGYNLHRGTVYPDTLPLIASNLADSSYKDQGLVNGVTYYYQLTAVDHNSNESPASEVVCSKPLPYLAGNFNGDEETNVVDVVAIVNYLFKGAEGHEPLEAGNVNCDEEVTISDVVYLINYLFKGGDDPCICTIPEELLARYKQSAKAILGLCFPAEDKSKEIEVMLEAEVEEQVAGVQIDLAFDPSQLEVKEISTTPRTDKLGLFYNVEPGKIKIGMVDIYGANTLTPGEGSLLKIKFQKKKTQAGISSAKIERAIVVNPLAQELNVQIQPNKVIKSIPQTFSLGQNYPNPFNARTVIRYSLPKDSKVKISIYNILGQKVKALVNEHQSAGHKSVVWDGKNQKGKVVASGVYFYRIQADDFTSARKMLLLK